MLVARRRKIYDTRATLQKEDSNYNYSKGSGYTGCSGYKYRTRSDPKRDYNCNNKEDEHGRHDNTSTKHANRYYSFTFRNLFEWTPFHKLFGKIELPISWFAFWLIILIRQICMYVLSYLLTNTELHFNKPTENQSTLIQINYEMLKLIYNTRRFHIQNLRHKLKRILN